MEFVSRPGVTIILINHHGTEDLKKFLNSFYQNNSYRPLQVIVVDCSGQGQTKKVVNDWSDRLFVKQIRLDRNCSQPAAGNYAARRALYPYLLFVDEKVVFTNDVLPAMTELLDKNEALGAVGIRLNHYAEGSAAGNESIYHAGIRFRLQEETQRYSPYYVQASSPEEVSLLKSGLCPAVTSEFLMCRKEEFLAVGGFHEEYSDGFSAIDFCLHLKKKLSKATYCYQDFPLQRAESFSQEAFSDRAEEVLLNKRCAGYFSSSDDELAAVSPVTVQAASSSLNNYFSFAGYYADYVPAGKSLQDLGRPRCLVFSHNLAVREGAPRSLQELLVGLKEQGSIYPVVVSPVDGNLREEYEKHNIPVIVSPVFSSPLARKSIDSGHLQVLEEKLAQFRDDYSLDGFLINTVHGFHFAHLASRLDLPVTWIIRESEGPDKWCSQLDDQMQDVFRASLKVPDQVVFVSEQTKACWQSALNPDPAKSTVIHNGVKLDRFAGIDRTRRRVIRESLGVNEDQVMLLTVGTICERKNQRQLIDALEQLPEQSLKYIKVFLVGGSGQVGSYLSILQEKVAKSDQLKERVHFVPETPAVGDYYLAADAFVLTSHYESYPRVVLEAMHFSLPIIANPVFGVLEQTVEGENALYYNPKVKKSLSRQIKKILNPGLRAKLASGSEQLYKKLLDYPGMIEKYGRLLGAYFAATGVRGDEPAQPAVSVVIPNYNYAHYLLERIKSILEQTYRPAEIIFLDDASSDNSVAVAEDLLKDSPVPYRIMVNDQNLGVYAQWMKGINTARGDYIWIAEADDCCHPTFLARLVDRAVQDSSALIYSQSKKIDEEGNTIAENNLFHTDDLSRERWQSDYSETGLREVVDYLFYRNTIPNISACLLKRECLQDLDPAIRQFRFCGDWYLYSFLLGRGSISYVADSLNYFRKHQHGVTRSQDSKVEYLDEILKVMEYLVERFPVHRRQINKRIDFLNRDHRIEGLSRNSDYPPVASYLSKLESLVADRKRLVFLTTNDGSHSGGSEQLWIQAAEQARQKGHDLMVVVKKWDPEPYFFAQFRRLGIKMLFKEEFSFDKIVQFEPDLMIINMGDQDEGIEWFAKCGEHDIPYIIVTHLVKEPEYWPIRAGKTEAVKQGYRLAKKVLYTSRNNHRIMERRLDCKLPNNDYFFNPYFISKSSQVPYPSTGQGLQLAVPARFMKIHKGQHLAIELMNKDKWRQREVVINFYGDGPDKEEMERLAKEYNLTSIRFHQPKWGLPAPDLSSIWRENHAIFMPSFMEGMPIVLINAMIHARMPIVTDVGGHSEVIDDNMTGFIARKPTVQDLDEALERAYMQRDKWEEIGQKARAKIIEWLPDDPIDHFLNKILAYIGGNANDLSAPGPEKERPGIVQESLEVDANRLKLSGQEHYFPILKRDIRQDDSMYSSSAKHYFECGASALAMIIKSMEKAGMNRQQVQSILDYGSGYGRVLRWLQAAFNNAEITACELDDKALLAVREMFGMPVVKADISLSRRLGRTFDIIWCGSVFTHLSQQQSARLIAYLAEHLNADGILVFSAHGRYVAERIRKGEKLYGLRREQVAGLLEGYDYYGYGYSNYHLQDGYGISVATCEAVNEMIKQEGLQPIFHKDRGWDKHHDVFAGRK